MASRIFRSRPPGSEPARQGVLWPHRIVVPVRGDDVDHEALRAACRLARPTKAQVLVLTVLEVARNLPLSARLGEDLARAEELLETMEGIASRLDTRIRTAVLQAREAGPAVVDEARRWEADLMVVGLGTKPQFGEFTLGTTGEELLRHAPCRLILIRPPLPESAGPAPAVIP
ncbi:MAG: universal stress protein [Candidatus Dormibacteria bacterium]